MTVWVLLLHIGSIYVPSDVSGKGDAAYRYEHECQAMVRDWQRYGYDGICVEKAIPVEK